MRDKRDLLRHFLASLAYRTQKAVHGAPDAFAGFRLRPDVRTPTELIRHMSSVLGYASTFFMGGSFRADPLESFDAEVDRFHNLLERLSDHFLSDEFERMTPERFLQGPLSDAMTHVGQLAMLRRLFDVPVPPENFIMADIQAGNLSTSQPDPVSPDEDWHTPAGPQRS